MWFFYKATESRDGYFSEGLSSTEQAKTLSLIFSSTKKQQIVKTTSACTESNYLLYKPSKKNIYLVAQSH
jgi:hypothetical protein